MSYKENVAREAEAYADRVIKPSRWTKGLRSVAARAFEHGAAWGYGQAIRRVARGEDGRLRITAVQLRKATMAAFAAKRRENDLTWETTSFKTRNNAIRQMAEGLRAIGFEVEGAGE